MSHIVTLDEKTGKYVAESKEKPELKVAADTLYDAIEKLHRLESKASK